MKKLLVMLLVIVSCISCVACGTSVGTGNGTNNDTDTSAEMKANLEVAVSDMMDAAILAEKILDMNVALWDDDMLYVEYIYTSDYVWETQEYLVQGFSAYQKIKENRTNVSNLKNAHITVSESNKKMIHWPESMSEEKEIYEALYDAYLNLYNLATSPSGNYINYSSNANAYVNEFSTQYQKIQAYLE